MADRLYTKWRRRPLVHDSITTSFWISVGKGAGFLVPFFIAAWFGVGAETDAFFFVYGLVLFLTGILASVIEEVIVPYIAEKRTQGEDVGEFVGGVLLLSGLGIVLLVGILLLASRPLLAWMTRFDSRALNLAFQLFYEISPLIVLLGWESILSGALNAYKHFAVPAVSPLFRALVNLLCIWTLRKKLGVHAMALGYVAGEMFRLVILVLTVVRARLFKIRFSLHPNLRLAEFFKIASFQTAAMTALGLNLVIDGIMASWLQPGSVSILFYAQRVYLIPFSFLAAGLMVPLLSHWSDRFYQEGMPRLRRDARKTQMWLAGMGLGVTGLLLLVQKWVVWLAYGRGAFTTDQLAAVQGVLACYVFGFAFNIMASMYLKAHLILKNTRTIMHVAFFLVFSNVGLNWMLMSFLQVRGIALATSLNRMGMFFFLAWAFHRKGRGTLVKSQGVRLINEIGDPL